jgi:hypothetical protein
MTLFEWKEHHGHTVRVVAEKLGWKYNRVRHYVYGTRRPTSPEDILHIQAVTGGEVRVEDWAAQGPPRDRLSR